MTDRRSFLARLSGALAGLVVGKDIAAVDAKKPTVITGTDFKLEVAQKPFGPASQYSTPGINDSSMEWVGGIPDGCVTLDGKPVSMVSSVIVYGASRIGKAVGHGYVKTWRPIRDREEDEFRYDGFSHLQEWTYKGYVTLNLPTRLKGAMRNW